MSLDHQPNPLRPYYQPPSNRFSTTQPTDTATATSKPTFTQTNNLGSSPRNAAKYSEYVPEGRGNTGDFLKELSEGALWKYASIFFAQPFDVAKTILQVQTPSRRPRETAKEAIVKDQKQISGASYGRRPYHVCSSLSSIQRYRRLI